MADGFRFQASFDLVLFDVTASRIEHGRKLARHSFPKRDGVNGEDMGREPRVIDLDFVFIDRRFSPGEVAELFGTEGDYLERFETFEKLFEIGDARSLIHPYVGTIGCRVERFTHEADAEGQPAIRCSATFVEEIGQEASFDSEPGITTVAGAQQVNAGTIRLDAARAGLNLGPSTSANEASLAAKSWQNDPTLSTRQVQLEMASINNKLNDELNALDAASDIDKHPIMKQYTLLQHNLRRAAETFTADSPRIVEITVTEPLPLRVIAARFYGAREADTRQGQLEELNPDVRRPMLVERGTVLKAFARTDDRNRRTR